MEPLPEKSESKQPSQQENAAKTESDKIEEIADRIIAAFTKINRANRKAEASENERTSTREKRRFKVELFEIFLISVYAFFTILEWNTFSTESRTMADELRSSQSNAIAEIKISQNQLNQTTLANQIDERGWLFVTIPNDALSFSGSNAVITMSDKNTGKTPVLVTDTYGWLAVDPKTIPPHDPMGTKNALMLIPNQEGKVVVTLPDIVAQGIVLNMKIYIYGTVRYRDIFQKNHWSQFCFCFDQNGRIMNPQNFHNSCDDLDANTQN